MFDSILKSAKSALFVDDGTAPQQAQAPSAPAHSTIGLGGSTSVPVASNGVNPEYVAAIKKATFGRNTALTSLMAAADKLASIIPDPATRLKSAHAMTGEGRTVRQIAEAVDVHLADVDGEALRFKTMIDSKIQTEVGGLQAQADALEAQRAQAQNDIQRAQERIAQLTQQVGELATQHSQAVTAINTKKSDFEQALVQFNAAANIVKAELNANKQAIVSTLV